MTKPTAFSSDYVTARDRFRQAVGRIGWQLETRPIGGIGPSGEELTIDVGYSADCAPEKALVVSSGIHGVEGYFGSAVQLALLQRWATDPPAANKYVFLHGLNPYGFAWHRRCNEHNIDLNRNFLLPEEPYEGTPAGYADLDPLLNPQRPPSRWELFRVKALGAIARHGMPGLRQVVAAGQYDFPQGLFYGGDGPSRTHQLLHDHMPRWLHGSRFVTHLDFHTGLGPKGQCKLLINYPLSQSQRDRLTDWFGHGSFDASDSSSIAYEARGELGRWCVASKLAAEYVFACAEFGTAGPIQVLAGLRAENQAHHWAAPSSAATKRAKQQLKELFCPSAESWRTQVLEHSMNLVDHALQGLSELPAAELAAAGENEAWSRSGRA